MKKIRIKNLKLLEDTGDIDIKKINIAVGCNSSGKSTYLRVFPLLRQSTERKTRGPILWNGNLVDFESFDNSVNRKTENDPDKKITFSFTFPISNYNRHALALNDENIEIKCEIEISRNKNGRGCFTSEHRVTLGNHELKFSFSEDGTLIGCKSNRLGWDLTGYNFKYQVTNTDSLFPIFNVDRYHYYGKEQDDKQITSIIFKQLTHEFREISGSSSIEKTQNHVRTFLSKYRSDEDRLNLLKKLHSTNKWRIHFLRTEVDDINFISGLADLFFCIDRSHHINAQLTEILNGVRYFAPLRTTAQRYYRYQDISVDEIDHKGDNLGMFISNIPRNKKSQLDEWTATHFNFQIVANLNGGHISLLINDMEREVINNIADVGFGYSQVLPIIIQLWSIASGYENQVSKLRRDNYLYVIEQPELHLHPKMQGLLTSVFVASIELASSNSIDLRFVIETHSTSIISKLGELVSKSKINRGDISILLFNNGDKITKSSFDDKGFLQKWPIGFLDY